MAKDFKSLIVVNLLAGPGAGKTSLALSASAALKRLGVNCELVTEVAKDYIYSGDFDTLLNQPYITTSQFQQLYRLAGKVDVAITDTSLLLGSVRSKDWVPEPFYGYVQGLYDLFDNVNFWVNRPPLSTYSEVGRVHDAEGAEESDVVIKEIVKAWGLQYQTVDYGDWVKVVAGVIEHLRKVGKFPR